MDGDTGTSIVESLTEREYDVLQLLAEGHSNRRVAELLVLSIHTVKWYNRQIYGKLGVDKRQEAVAMARSQGLLPAPGAQAAPGHHLPAPSMPLLGRERELNELQRLLTDGDARLVSIVAPGGMGKTHLALEAAHRLAAHFADGAAFANLAPLPSAEGIVPTMAQALGLKLSSASDDPRQQLLHFLRGKSLLLILDNFEHLLDGAPLLAEMVATAPNVCLLITSRERLQLQAEHVFPLQGLYFGGFEALGEAHHHPAIQLFLAYGRRLRPGFALQAQHLKPLQRILQLSQGMPLALILAAAWLELLEPAQIADEIEKGLGFLEADYRDLPPRQRSMRAVFKATWERLNKQEQTHLASLSVFRGGFTLDAARQVAGARPKDLRRLLRRSLLARGEDGRLEIHELMRQFAAEQLSRMPSLQRSVRDAHSAYYLERLRQHEPHLKGAGAEDALSQIEGEFQNHHAAWSWAVEQRDFTPILPAAMSLATFYLRRGRYQEGLTAFSRAVQIARRVVSGQTAEDSVNLRALVRLLAWQSELLFAVAAIADAEACALEALSLLETAEGEGQEVTEEQALVYLCLSRIYEWVDRYQEATDYLEECVAHARALGDHWLMADAIHLQGGVAMRRGHYELAILRMNEAREHYRLLGDRRSEAYTKMWVATIRAWWWPTAQAERELRECLSIFRALGDRNAEGWARHGLGSVRQERGDLTEASALFSENATLYESLGMKDRLAGAIGEMAAQPMHKGNYELAMTELQRAREIARGSKMPFLAAYLLMHMGKVRLAQRYADEARQFLGEGASILRDIGQNDDLSEALAVLSCACSAAGQLEEARQALVEALTWSAQLRSFRPAMHVLAASALFLTRSAKEARAFEIWELANRYPYVAHSAWFADVAGQHVEAAAAALPADAVREARERGKALDVWATVAQLQQEL